MEQTAATPEALAWTNGTIVLARDATVPLTDDGVLRGDGVFETMLVRNGLIHALPQHHRRLMRSAATLDVAVPDVITPMTQLLDAWGPHDGIAKIVVLRGGTLRLIVSPPAPWPGTLSLDVQDMPWGGPLAGAKTLSYALNQFSVRLAQARGCDDALIVHDNQVRELAHGSIVLVEDGVLISPDPATADILDSVTLGVLASVRTVRFEPVEQQRLATADELFVLSATRLAVGVSRLLFADGQIRTFDAPGPLTRDANEALEAHVTAHAKPPSLT